MPRHTKTQVSARVYGREGRGALHVRILVGFFSQEKVAVVEESDDECLDQDLCCFTCEEGPDPADVVETNSTRSGHRGDVGIAAQLHVCGLEA